VAGLPWQEPYWASDRPKHWPPKEDLWPTIITETGSKGSPARYSPELTVADIERIEMECVEGVGVEFDSPRPHVRHFFREIDFEVGASNGRLVRFVYVEYHQSGAVHGGPISIEELRKKGADA
jgi:hypothetical protein